MIFPFTTRRILVGREVSLKALQYAEEHEEEIVVCAQRNMQQEQIENPMLDLYSVRVLARVSNVTQFPNGYVKVVLEGEMTVELRSMDLSRGYMRFKVRPKMNIISHGSKSTRFEQVLNQFKEFSMHRNIAEGMVDALFTMDSHVNAFYGMIPFLPISLSERQAILEIDDIEILADRLLEIMVNAASNDNVMVRVQQNVRQKMAQQQKEWFSSEQIRLLQEELDTDGGK